MFILIHSRFLATLLLFSFLLESCCNPNIGMGKKAIPPAQEASGGNTYHEDKKVAPLAGQQNQDVTPTSEAELLC